jgi:hypothetical protein
MQLPVVTGVVAKYYGGASLGTTNWYYWVQALYTDGYAQLSNSASTGAKLPATLTSGNRVALTWNPAPGAIGYIVYRNNTGTTPTTGNIVAFIATAETDFDDYGQNANIAGTVRYDGIYVAQAKYNFANDGGAIGAITPAISDSIPANAIVMGAIINSPTAVTSAGSATISIGTTAGSGAATILAATAKASFSIDAIQYYLAGTGPFGAAAFKMSATGQINLTVAVAALTAGLIEIFVFYVLPTNV